MKTADLIPFLLLELNESDKYGFELTKNIESKSNGKIIIKQPTLYTVLKKLEKSKFITSYWQDSEIGGKRHYYKITDNGKLQLSTLPSYEILLQNLIANEEAAENEELHTESENNSVNLNNTKSEEKSMPSTPIEAILPTSEVFLDNSLDTSTEVEINNANAELLKENSLNDQTFVNNENVRKFIETKPTTPPETKSVNNIPVNEIINLSSVQTSTKIDVDYAEYVNLKKSVDYQKSKKFTKLLILKSVFVSMIILVMLSAFAILSKRYGTSPIYYTSLITGLIIVLFYPILTALQTNSLTKKYKKTNYKFNAYISVITKFSLFCVILLTVLLINIGIDKNTFVKIFSIYNFSNFYVPILLSFIMFIDTAISNILSIKLNK